MVIGNNDVLEEIVSLPDMGTIYYWKTSVGSGLLSWRGRKLLWVCTFLANTALDWQLFVAGSGEEICSEY